MSQYKCTVCNYIYDEAKSDKGFSELPDDWVCPVCGSPKSVYVALNTETRAAPETGSTVADILVRQMAEWGVEYVFSIPGTSSLGIVDAIRKEARLKYIQVRHEQTASFMASAYGKLTGHLAACLTIAGPGASNLATGLYDAKLDFSPVLALTGQVKRQLIGPGSFQEIDQHSFFQPICVFNKILMSDDQTTSLVTLAIKHALVERGVAHLSIPNDVQKMPLETPILPMAGRLPNMNVQPCEYLLKAAAEIIDQSSRPVIIAGYGAVGQGGKLVALASKIGAPVVTTFRGKGLIDESDERYVGCHGTIGSTAATKLIADSDLLIVIGSSFADKTQIPEKRTVQIDINPMMLARKFPVEAGLLGNSAYIIPRLTRAVRTKKNPAYIAEIKRLKQQWQDLLAAEISTGSAPVRPPYIIKVIHDLADKNAVFSVDVGEHAWWFGRNFWMGKEQRVILSGSLASMGFGLPGALAAQLAFPDRQVICITGDGGLAMVMGDFLTAVKYSLPVKIFVFNNHQLGMIMQEQKFENYPNWQTELHNCDFAEYAQNCGATGIKVTKPEEMADAVKRAFGSDKPVIVDINTDPGRFPGDTGAPAAAAQAAIEPAANGPYLVRDLGDLRNSLGEALPTKPEMSLCRCRGSNTKPYCDGTHSKIGFSDQKEPDRVPDKTDDYEGKEITIHDNRGVCSHAGYCTDNSPKVFRMGAEPWIDPDGDDAEKTTRTIRMCPSGALSYTRDGKLLQNQERDPSVGISRNGPYRVVGSIKLHDPAGSTPESKEHYTLCRCGASKNKPFCSGMHWNVDFHDEIN